MIWAQARAATLRGDTSTLSARIAAPLENHLHQAYFTNEMAGKLLMASKFTEPVRAAFLEALSHLGEWKAAAATVGVSYTCVWERRQRDPLFEEACKRAMGRLDAELMAVARDLAIKGRLVETHDKDGKVIRTEHKISDRLLHAWLKRRMPQEWGDKVQVDQHVTANITHSVQAKDLTREQRNRVRDLLDTLPTDN